MAWTRWMMAALAASMLGGAAPAAAQGFVHREGKQIVDAEGRPLLLRGMGLGGWMLQEGYMLELGGLEKGQQHVIRRRITELVGEEKAAAFYRAWLDNFTTKADIDAMARWGFNSVRLPMHYNLFTLPIEREPVAGRDTWIEDGFARVDRLLEWTRANNMHLILDLHAAPGGQGNDLPISDRDPAKPSLWESAENRRKTVALWKKLAERYANEPGIAAYDVLNEPNWDFDGPKQGHGCTSKANVQLWDFYREVIAAIRSVDRNHMIIIEGNCWGNNYGGLDAPLDANSALSFHKYWNRNDRVSIEGHLALRDKLDLPLWLGETGENSNTWFRDAIALVEGEGIGWAWWPLKKIRYNNPLQVNANPGWHALVAYWLGKGPKPSGAAAEAALMRLATHDVRYANNLQHPDVIDAMFRQPHTNATLAFKANRIGRAGGRIAAVDFDLGRAGYAYWDREDANYHVATGAERVTWNSGTTYRNDGVDIAVDAKGAPYVTSVQAGEWLQYTVDAEQAGVRSLSVRARGGAGGTLSLAVNGRAPVSIAIPAGSAWTTVRFAGVELMQGRNRLVLKADSCTDCEIDSLAFADK
ncbi:cellulase family glycosylhydrolase [Sphingomonas sp. BT-65]|uniref:cellulase family glycosylhydrolase n=1 Tax=Sphingomonas sp. BT-65 TaxID=2989821 RepID=UPI0022355CF1|nr:cellulase family glycosylhydrolase [Sphingomonas sp. BT-65]MCW4460773.1 cellulase family glycosylhydrolase [Sphingomonas sp. BT-65]